MSEALLYGILAALGLLILIVIAAVRIVPEYERGVIFRLGRVIGAKGRGCSSSSQSSTGWCGSISRP